MRHVNPFICCVYAFLLLTQTAMGQCQFLGQVTNDCNLSVQMADGTLFEIGTPSTSLQPGQMINFSYTISGQSATCSEIDLINLDCYTILDNNCADFGLIDLAQDCGEVYDPVCGCDGITYVNACQAEYYNGLLQWSPGACAGYPLSCTADFLFAYIDDNTVVFYNISTAYNTASWDFDGGTIDYQGSESVVVNFSQDNAEVCLTISNSDGCSDTYCQVITMDSPDDLCNNTDCVWPGDTDGDRKANAFDLLNIGLGFDAVGPPRDQFPVEDDPIAWIPNYADNWGTAVDAVDYKHLDCDGNGHVNEDDILAIEHNYTPDFDYISIPVNDAPPIFIEFTTPEVIVNDNSPETITLEANLYAGSTPYNVENLHGMALSILFPFDLVVPGSVDFTYYEDSFFGAPDSIISVEYDLAGLSVGRFDLALSRKSTTGAIGLGEIGTFSFVVSSDIIDGLSTPEIPFDVIIDKVKFVNEIGEELEFNIPTPNGLTFINDTIADHPDIDYPFETKIYPNPARDRFYVNAGTEKLEQLQLIGTDGTRYGTYPATEQVMSIPVDDLPSGVYFLQIRAESFTENRRIIVE